MTEFQAKLLQWFRNHAAAQMAQGNKERAGHVLETALEFSRRHLEDDDDEHAADIFAVLASIARLKLDSGDAEEAVAYYQEGLGLTERPQVNLDTETIAEAQQHLGMALDRLGREAEAAENFQQALAAMESVDPPPFESIAHLANNLGMICRNRGEYSQAEEHYQRALEIFQHFENSHQLDAAIVCNNLGTLYWAWRQPQLARDFHLQAIKIRREHLPDTHPDIGQSACNLAAVYHDLGDFDKATFNYDRALKILRRNLKGDPETYRIVANNYADLLDEHGQEAKANKFRLATEKRLAKFT